MPHTETIALVIGNNNYSNNPLNNAVNDAKAISTVFERLGYQTILKTDLTYTQMIVMIDDFKQSIKDFKVAIVYFAGHAFQDADVNYLTSIESNFDHEGQAKYTSWRLDDLISIMDSSDTETNIIILDACRNNPFKNKKTRGSEDVSLANVFAPRGTLIAFSTSPGQTAGDGDTEHSRYTKALMDHMLEPRLPIEEVFKRVRGTVYAFSGSQQVPWEHTSLIAPFSFNTGQLSYSSSIPYPIDLIRIETFVASDLKVDQIVDGLLSESFNRQNDALREFKKMAHQSVGNNKAFAIGRGIIAAAEAGNFLCKEYISQLSRNIAPYDSAKQNHLLNGLLYETYFNSQGTFRFNQIRSKFITEILNCVELPKYTNSLKFVEEILEPYQNALFYVPGESSVGLSVNMTLVKVIDSTNEYMIKSIDLNGRSIFIDRHQFQTLDISSKIPYPDLHSYIAEHLHVPKSRLKLNINISFKKGDYVVFPISKYFNPNWV